MFFSSMLASLPFALSIFLLSLVVVVASSARFTGKLEVLCESFNLSIATLSLLGALGANIPNYVSSALAILSGHGEVGIGIIVGSNIFNLSVIPGLCALFAPERAGMTFDMQARRGVHAIAHYSILITLLSFLFLAWLPVSPLVLTLHVAGASQTLLLLTNLVVLALFAAQLVHILRRSQGHGGTALHHHGPLQLKASLSRFLSGGEVLLTLVVALGGVLVMVQAGQALTSDLHLSPVLAGLLVLAVATSLPNAVVAVSLVRTGEVAACVEEIWGSASINIVLGIMVPLLFLQRALADPFLLLLDAPLTTALMVIIFLGVFRGRVGRGGGVLLLALYAAWVLIRLWL